MSPTRFTERLHAIRKGGYEVLPFDQAIQRLYSGSLPDRAVALTFDDGAHDFAAMAVPILREFDMPATVYLTTYYAERGGPVFDTMSNYLLWCGLGRVISGDSVTSHGHQLDLRTRAHVARAAQDVYNYSRERSLSSDEKAWCCASSRAMPC
ncbi:MAG: polysaccharide deacetylase family protein [Gemmatimonadaceae bacterium]